MILAVDKQHNAVMSMSGGDQLLVKSEWRSCWIRLEVGIYLRTRRRPPIRVGKRNVWIFRRVQTITLGLRIGTCPINTLENECLFISRVADAVKRQNFRFSSLLR